MAFDAMSGLQGFVQWSKAFWTSFTLGCGNLKPTGAGTKAATSSMTPIIKSLVGTWPHHHTLRTIIYHHKKHSCGSPGNPQLLCAVAKVEPSDCCISQGKLWGTPDSKRRQARCQVSTVLYHVLAACIALFSPTCTALHCWQTSIPGRYPCYHQVWWLDVPSL